jgi:osmotically-inducible protein OsmY
MMRIALSLGVACALLVLLACGGTDPEKQLRQASEEVAARTSVVEHARQELEQREQSLKEAEAEANRARQALRDAERRLEAARQEVAKHASDDVLFRTVQRRLLEDGKLQGVAIAAQVKNRVVTLRGSVEKAAQRDRALELARETPGVDGVESRIDVEEGSGDAAPSVAAPAPGQAKGT